MQNIQNSVLSFDENRKVGIALENIASTAGYNQMINKPTHFTNISARCIDLIFTSKTRYLTIGIKLSIYDKCHHKTIYGKLNFNIPLPTTTLL